MNLLAEMIDFWRVYDNSSWVLSTILLKILLIFFFVGGSWPPMSCCTSVSFDICYFTRTSMKRIMFGTWAPIRNWNPQWIRRLRLLVRSRSSSSTVRWYTFQRFNGNNGGWRFRRRFGVQCMCTRSNSQFPAIRDQILLLRVDFQMPLQCHQEVWMLKLEGNAAMKRNQDWFGNRAANLRLVFAVKYSD